MRTLYTCWAGPVSAGVALHCEWCPAAESSDITGVDATEDRRDRDLHRAQTKRDTYQLFVATDGCYTATVDAVEGHLGWPTLKALDGRDARHLLDTFEGCFDTT